MFYCNIKEHAQIYEKAIKIISLFQLPTVRRQVFFIYFTQKTILQETDSKRRYENLASLKLDMEKICKNVKQGLLPIFSEKLFLNKHIYFSFNF